MQELLEVIEENDILYIKNLGILQVRDIVYTGNNFGIIFTCKDLGTWEDETNANYSI